MKSYFSKSNVNKRKWAWVSALILTFLIFAFFRGSFLSHNYSQNNFRVRQNIKTIGNFEKDSDLEIWEKAAVPFVKSTEHATQGKYSLKIIFPRGEYPGISSIFSSSPEDWSKFNFLRLDVYNEQPETLKLCAIIKDDVGQSYQERFDGVYSLSPGLNNISIDLTQLRRNGKTGFIKLTNIIQYVFCLVKPKEETVIYLDNIRLEKSLNAQSDNSRITVSIDAETVCREISPLLFGSNLTPRTTNTNKVAGFLKDVGITIVRFPGGTNGYHWKTGFFDYWTDKHYMYSFSKYKNVVNFCKDTNSQLLIQINLESGTPEEAVEWVKYTNKELGFYVKYWELGNEAYGNWDKAYRSAEVYSADLREYSQAMKAVDPSIKIGANWGGEYFGDWDEIIVRNAGEYIDFFSHHWYPNQTSRKKKFAGREHPEPLDVAANAFCIPQIVERMKLIIERECPERQGKIEFAFTEWDGAWDAPTYDPEPYEQGIMQWSLANALFYAEALAQFIKEGVTLSTNYSVQECPFGLIRGHYTEVSRDNVAWDGKTIRPKAFVNKLFRKHFGERLVISKVENSPIYSKSPDWYPSYSGEVPYFSCLVSKNKLDNKLYIMLINRHPSKDLSVDFEIQGFDFNRESNIWVLTGPEITSQNDGNPGEVDIAHEQAQFSGPNFHYLSPAHSIVSIELNKENIISEKNSGDNL